MFALDQLMVRYWTANEVDNIERKSKKNWTKPIVTMNWFVKTITVHTENRTEITKWNRV